MSAKIKSTIHFVQTWPTENRREETQFVIVSVDKDAAVAEVSKVVDSWTCTEQSGDGIIVYQCYLKHVVTATINEASFFDESTAEIILSDLEVLKFIIDNKVLLRPAKEHWESVGSKAAFVTHDVNINGQWYTGMSVQDAINTHVNKVDESLLELK